MCGRYATTRSAADLSALFEARDDTAGALRPDWNVAPTDPVPLVRDGGAGGRVLGTARWGLVPAWSRDPRGGARMINARAETVAGSRAYGAAFARRRALIPADGWYEWCPREGGRGKQAYFMTSRDGGPVVFAGLWATWRPRTGPDAPLVTCTIVTTAARGELTRVHHRMPLLLPRDRWVGWLAGGAAPDLLAPPDGTFLAGLELRPVGPAVGDVRQDGPHLVAPATFDAQDLTLF